MIHRGIGILHQLAEFSAILRGQRDADTGTDEELAPLQYESLLQAFQNTLGNPDGPVQRLVAAFLGDQQQGELVAAHARHGIFFGHAGLQALGNFLEHAVTRRVAQRVVDRFEAVQVEEHQCHPLLMPCSMLQRGMQAVLEQRAVG